MSSDTRSAMIRKDASTLINDAIGDLIRDAETVRLTRIHDAHEDAMRFAVRGTCLSWAAAAAILPAWVAAQCGWSPLAIAGVVALAGAIGFMALFDVGVRPEDR